MSPATQFLSAGFLGAIVFTLAATPLWRQLCSRLGLIDDPNHRKIHAEVIPLAGGPAVLTGMLLTTLVFFVWMLGSGGHLSDAAENWPLWLVILCGAVAMTVLGMLDDRHELGPGIKFIGQLLVALGVAIAGVRITLMVPNATFHYLVTVLWILTLVNAFNFIDNMNGLCAGLGAIASGTFAGAAVIQGQYPEALMGLLVCGALLGFLPFNYPRARAFLGDSGSHLVGYCVAVLAILPHFHTDQNPKPWAVLKPLLILAVPLADLIWVVCLRTLRGKAFYIGDTNHLSHQLVKRGMNQPGAVALLWSAAAVCGVVALFL